MKKLIIFTITLLLLTGCAKSNAPQLSTESIETFEVTEVTPTPEVQSTAQAADLQSTESSSQTNNTSQPVGEKFAAIDFSMVSGNYCRNVTHDDVEYTEMFVTNKNNFIRVARNDVEQEVFAYNYSSDDFTYLYYYDGELISKTVFNLTTGAILEDPEEYAELLKTEAEEIKIYFNDLLDASGLDINDLNSL